jgi:pimeloyl-ACP methyl ester carboxylesterase
VSLTFTTSQGGQTAFFIPPRVGAVEKPDRVWVCCAGNGSLALDWLHFIPGWKADDGFLLVDYPGYGDCAGSPRPERIRENTRGAIRALAAHLHVSMETLQPRLCGLGHSMGCAAVLMAADDFKMQRVVLISPFTTMTEMARRVIGWPLCWLNHHRFDNRQHLAAVVEHGAKVRVFHGVNDSVIPVSMSRELAALHPASVTLTEVPNAGHNDVLSIAAREIGAAMR